VATIGESVADERTESVGPPGASVADDDGDEALAPPWPEGEGEAAAPSSWPDGRSVGEGEEDDSDDVTASVGALTSAPVTAVGPAVVESAGERAGRAVADGVGAPRPTMVGGPVPVASVGVRFASTGTVDWEPVKGDGVAADGSEAVGAPLSAATADSGASGPWTANSAAGAERPVAGGAVVASAVVGAPVPVAPLVSDGVVDPGPVAVSTGTGPEAAAVASVEAGAGAGGVDAGAVVAESDGCFLGGAGAAATADKVVPKAPSSLSLGLSCLAAGRGSSVPTVASRALSTGLMRSLPACPGWS
jgi:hypothetical protein